MDMIDNIKKVIVILLLPLIVMQIKADTEYANGYTWSYSISEEGATIKGYMQLSSTYFGEVPAVSPNPVGTLTIPSMLGGKQLICIGWLALSHCNDLTVVIIPSCVTKFHSQAFQNSDSPARIDFKGRPPKVEGYYDVIVRSVGTYMREYESEWRAVINNEGYWYGLKMQVAQSISYTVSYYGNEGIGTMIPQSFESGTPKNLTKNAYTKDGYVFQGWAETADGPVKYTDEQEITVDHDMTLYAVWAQVDCIVHFIANGGVFKDKNENVVEQFDQYFTYGEAQRLFTDELTPVRMDGNGNRFLGWSRGTPNIASSDLLFGGRQEWTFHDGVTEEWFYAVWTTTVTVSFYNSETTSGDRLLSPSSLADHLRWSVDDGLTGGRGIESPQGGGSGCRSLRHSFDSRRNRGIQQHAMSAEA